MNPEAEITEPDGFGASRDRFEAVVGYLRGPDALSLEHAELEAKLAQDMREVIRQLCQDHLDLRAGNEKRLDDVVSAEGTPHRAIEADHERPLSTIFGEVTVRRLAYRHRGVQNLYPADAALNLPEELHSHGRVPSKVQTCDSSLASYQAASGQRGSSGAPANPPVAVNRAPIAR